MAGEPVTREMAEDAIRRNSTGPSDLPKLTREVLWALDAKGYDVDAPVRFGYWALAGAAGLVIWVLLVLLVLWLIGVI